MLFGTDLLLCGWRYLRNGIEQFNNVNSALAIPLSGGRALRRAFSARCLTLIACGLMSRGAPSQELAVEQPSLIEMSVFRIVGAFLLTLAATGGVVRAMEPQPALFTLSSPAFSDDGMLPLKYAGGTLCGKDSHGGNISPPLAWSNPPPGTKSFAVIMIDPDGRRGLGSVHWVAYGIPGRSNRLERRRRRSVINRYRRRKKFAWNTWLYRPVRSAC